MNLNSPLQLRHFFFGVKGDSKEFLGLPEQVLLSPWAPLRAEDLAPKKKNECLGLNLSLCGGSRLEDLCREKGLRVGDRAFQSFFKGLLKVLQPL